MTEPDPLRLLLEKVREAFAATSVALLERDRDSWRQVAATGANPITSPEEAGVDVAVDPGLHLVLSGRVLTAAERHVLRGVAGQALLALRAQRLAAEAVEARRRAETTELRSALLSAVGHDLRTPLANVKAAVGSLRQPEVTWTPAQTAQLLATIEESTDRLTSLVTNLLDMSRLRADAVTVRLAPVAPDEVVARSLLLEHGPPVDVDVPDDLPPVLADAGLLERVLANLVENAVRFTPVGARVCVHGEAAPSAAVSGSGTVVRLQVVDHGPGIPDDRLDAMFAAFGRGDDRGPGPHVGLGLAICRGFTEAMGGSITPSTTPGGGLTMTVTLPAARS